MQTEHWLEFMLQLQDTAFCPKELVAYSHSPAQLRLWNNAALLSRSQTKVLALLTESSLLCRVKKHGPVFKTSLFGYEGYCVANFDLIEGDILPLTIIMSLSLCMSLLLE